jgi:hypothetical protein
MNTELEPCPFCESPAEEPYAVEVVYCTNPDCEANRGGICRGTWQSRPQTKRLLSDISGLESIILRCALTSGSAVSKRLLKECAQAIKGSKGGVS